MRYAFHTCDVFTGERFGGNQLAVLPDASGLSGEQMQAIAAEFNLSETSFVLPPADPAHLARLRIFTPRAEVPFAGHPTIGTVLVLAWLGRVPGEASFVLEEEAGLVRAEVRFADGRPVSAEFTAPAAPWHGAPVDPRSVADALGLALDDLRLGQGLPAQASCGTPFLFVELAGLAALGRARLDVTRLPAEAGENGVFLFTAETGDPRIDLRARMFAPQFGIPEDPATGSAAAALAGFLAGRPGLAEGWHGWRIAQGLEMGRPSLIEARARRAGGAVAEVRIAGGAVPVSEGTIEAGA